MGASWFRLQNPDIVSDSKTSPRLSVCFHISTPAAAVTVIAAAVAAAAAVTVPTAWLSVESLPSLLVGVVVLVFRHAFAMVTCLDAVAEAVQLLVTDWPTAVRWVGLHAIGGGWDDLVAT